MKKSLFLYLFIVAVLVNIFTYMYYSKQLQFKVSQAEKTNKKLKDSAQVLYNDYVDAHYFTLKGNQNAQNYLSDLKPSVYYEELIPKVADKLLSFNDEANGNPYTGFEKMDGAKFIINKALLLNHRWIIADFSNGDMWGEALIKYFVNDDGSIDFEMAENFLYSKSQD